MLKRLFDNPRSFRAHRPWRFCLALWIAAFGVAATAQAGDTLDFRLHFQTFAKKGVATHGYDAELRVTPPSCKLERSQMAFAREEILPYAEEGMGDPLQVRFVSMTCPSSVDPIYGEIIDSVYLSVSLRGAAGSMECGMTRVTRPGDNLFHIAILADNECEVAQR
ncbi:MAG: hypothetical protein RIB84_17895 [Sneathiellaceae bacterium]